MIEEGGPLEDHCSVTEGVLPRLLGHRSEGQRVSTVKSLWSTVRTLQQKW